MKKIENGAYRGMLEALLNKETSNKLRKSIHIVFFLCYLLQILFVVMPIIILIEIFK